MFLFSLASFSKKELAIVVLKASRASTPVPLAAATLFAKRFDSSNFLFNVERKKSSSGRELTKFASIPLRPKNSSKVLGASIAALPPGTTDLKNLLRTSPRFGISKPPSESIKDSTGKLPSLNSLTILAALPSLNRCMPLP